MTRDQLDQLTRRYLAAKLDEIEDRLALEWTDEAGKDVHVWDLCDLGHELESELRTGDYTRALPDVRTHAPGVDDETERKLARRFLEAQLDAVGREVQAFTGKPFALPRALEAGPVADTPATPRTTPRFSEVAELYADDRLKAGAWTPKTNAQHRTILRLLAELLRDPPIGDVTKEAIRQLGHDIAALPSNMGKKFPGIGPLAVLEALNDDTKTPRLEPRSVNKYRQLARSLFKWAAAHDVIASNPAAILGDVKEGPARDDRHPFTDDDLRAYFAALPQSPQPEPFLYWIPRILAYTGMRLGESAKLRKEDIRQERGLWVFDVNRAEGRRLKTDASQRLVPIHLRLVELGILEFVHAAPPGFLWPERWRVTDSPTRGDMDPLSKLLARRLRAAGVTDPKKTGAHSFRHTVATRLKAESVPDYQIADLIGHEDDSMTTGRYGKATDVARLSEVVALVRLPV
jgi:integrase